MNGMNGHLPLDERMTCFERELLYQRAELEQAKRRISYLESLQIQGRSEFPPGWGLTSLESRVLRSLVSNYATPGSKIVDVVYADLPTEKRPDAKVIHVMIHRLRVKMRRHDIEIATRRWEGERGYYLPKRSLELLRAALVELPG